MCHNNLLTWKKQCNCQGLSSYPKIDKSDMLKLTGSGVYGIKKSQIVPPVCEACGLEWVLVNDPL